LIQLRRLAEHPNTKTTRGRTKDNRQNLSETFIQAIYDEYGNTTLGRQELEGELLSEIPGALFSRKLIDENRVKDVPSFERIVVAVDPAVTANENSDESGIVVCGVSQREFYVLEDLSFIGSPDAVCTKAIKAYHKWKADRVVFEANNGGDTWRTILNGIDPQVSSKNVHASRGKFARAEPVAARYEQGRVHHVGAFDAMEDQMCNYVPGVTRHSPDRMDALVWAITELDSKRNRDILIDPGENYAPQVWF
jgi:phage terminase large subunit-like protein